MIELKLKIKKAIEKAQREPVLVENLYEGTNEVKKNQYLFFIKPEITQKISSVKIMNILDIIFSKLDEYNFEINNVRLLGAKYMGDYDVIAQHYGVINQLSRNAFDNLSEASKQKFKEIYNQSASKDIILGSLEFLANYPDYTPESLNDIWKDTPNHKLGGGTYICKIQIGAKDVFIVNGFHPMQLDHFTKEGRSIVAFTITSDIDWNIARTEFIGVTNPGSAKDGSLRKMFLEQKNELGLPEIDGSKNGVHLSAGPVEALVELMRFNSDRVNNIKLNIDDYSFGKLLANSFPKDFIDKVLENKMSVYKDQNISVFDLTEEKNSQEAIEILKETNF